MDNKEQLNQVSYRKNLKKDVIILLLFKIILITTLVFFIKNVKPKQDECVKRERIKPALQESS